jgi:Nif-specific regulatory protein
MRLELETLFGDPDHGLPALAKAAKRATGATEAGLMAVSRDGRLLREVFRSGGKPRNPLVLRVGIEGIGGWVAKFGRPALVPDNSKDSRYVRTSDKYRSMVCVPVRAGGRVIGVLSCESTRRGHFTRKHVRILEELAPVAGGALRIVDLLDRERRGALRLGMLNLLTRLMTVLDPLSFARRCVDQVRRAFDVFYAGVRLGNYKREEVVLVAHSAAGAASPVPRLKFGQGLTGKAFKLGETVNARDVKRDPFYVQGIPGIVSELCVPARMGDHCVGILDLQSREPAAFDAEDVTLVETVARLLAPALSAMGS